MKKGLAPHRIGVLGVSPKGGAGVIFRGTSWHPLL